MDKIPLTNYQFIAYFMSGFALMLSIFITFEPIKTFADLLDCTKNLSIGFLALSIFLSFLFGLIVDAVRNGIVDNSIDWLIKKKVINGKYTVDWSYFYKGDSEKVGYFYARYFTYYSFDFNLVISLLTSLILIDPISSFPCKFAVNLVIPISILFLLIDAFSLRVEMGKVTTTTNAQAAHPTAPPAP